MSVAREVGLNLCASTLAGTTAGSIAAAATAQTTDSVHTPGQAFVLWLILAVCFGLAFAAIGMAASVGLRLWARRRSGSATAGRSSSPMALASSIFLFWGILVGGLWLHDLVIGRPLPDLVARPPLVAAAAVLAWLAARGLGKSLRARRVAFFGFSLVSLGILGTMMAMRTGAPETVTVAQSKKDAKVLLIALDGADWERIDELVARRSLPTIESMLERGYRAPLETIRPTYSPIIWTTLISGTREADHGIHRFTSTALPGLPCGLQGVSKSRRLPPKLGLGKLSELAYGLGAIKLRPISGCHRRRMALWNILSEAGRRVAISNWYVSWPADPVNGSLVSDYNPARARYYSADLQAASTSGYTGITHPADLFGELADLDLPPLDARPSETLALPFFQDLSEERLRAIRAVDWMPSMFRTIYMSDVFSSEAVLHLMEREPADFTAFYMTGIDNVSHRWGKEYPEMVDRYYEWVDGVLARVLERAGSDTTVIVVSDHGWDYGYKGRFGHMWGPDGVLLAVGPRTQHGTWSEIEGPKPSIYDIAPTVLSHFGLPAAEDMPGRVLELGVEGVAEGLPRIPTYGRYQAPPLPESDPNVEGGDETMEKLKALGYLD